MLHHVARRATAAIEHDRNIERRLRTTKFRCVPHCGKGLDRVGRPCGANVQRQRALKPNLRLRLVLLFRRPWRGSARKFRGAR